MACRWDALKTPYEQKVEALFPQAKQIANAKVAELGKRFDQRIGPDGKRWNYCYWSEFFHAAMKTLAIEAGIRSA